MSAETTRTRKYLFLVIEAPDEDMVGRTRIDHKQPMTSAEKNTVGVREKRDMNTGETWTEREVGLGYADFDSEADYKENIADVVHEKLNEIDAEHIEAAGLDPEEVRA